MMTASECKAALQAAVAAATAIIAQASAGGYDSALQIEADINAVRTTLAVLLPEIDRIWGVDGVAAQSAFRALAARLIDMRALVTDSVSIITEPTQRPSNAISLAYAWYGDYSRWTELLDLNPALPWPARIPEGMTLVRHGR